MGIFSKIYQYPSFRKHPAVWFLVSVAFLFALLRLPSLIEPNWYGDEGIYQVVGRAMHKGALLYQDIWDNKPPLLYSLYALLNGNLFFVKLASLISGLLSVVVFFLIARKLFKGGGVYVATTLFAILFATPVLEGNIANAENFMALPTLAALYLVLHYLKTKRVGVLILAGLLLSVSFLIKIVAVFDFLAFFFFLLLIGWDEMFRRSTIVLSRITPFIIFAVSFLSLFILTLLYFVSQGAFTPFYKAVFGGNVGYVGFENTLLFPMGILIVKSLILLTALIYLFIKRNTFSTSTLLVYVWLVFSMYNAFFSHRAYTHYLLVLLPAFCLLIAHLISNKKTRLLDVLLMVAIIATATMHFTLYRYSYPYYQNYFKFVTGKSDITEYQLFFDRNTPRDYEVASFIKLSSQEGEKVFLWSDSAQIYALSDTLPLGKYVAAYHMTFYEDGIEEAQRIIETHRPRYIIQTADYPQIKDFLSSYDLRYRIQGVIIYEREI